MKLLCPHCQQKLEAPTEMYGQLTACPTCTKELQIPAEPIVEECCENQEETGFCTFCGKQNEIGAIKCKHCQASLHCVSCPGCNQRLRLKDNTSSKVKCPVCKKVFEINDRTGATAQSLHNKGKMKNLLVGFCFVVFIAIISFIVYHLYRDDKKVEAEAYEQLDAKSQYSLGLRYYNGNTIINQDRAKAVKWFRKAAERGFADAQYRLGWCYDSGNGVTQDKEEAVKWYRKAAKHGHKQSQDTLRTLFAGTEEDFQAAEQGNSQAQFQLAEQYYNAKNIPNNYIEAAKWYRKAAEQGNAEAQKSLGSCYFNGSGVAKDAAEAVKWYRKAAEQEDAEAQKNLGNCYLTGTGVAKDQAEAVKWYRKAAEKGFADAQFNLGLCYAKGWGIAEDETNAAEWYLKASEKGFMKAQYNLGLCYFFGKGIAKDQVKAAKWFYKAAEQKHADAQYNLGVCYANGWGIAKDETKATEWYQEAAKNGNDEAKLKIRDYAMKTDNMPANATMPSMKAAMPSKKDEEKIKELWDPWNGSIPSLVRAVKQCMNNPSSFEHVETRASQGINGRTIDVIMTFRGKNAFNALVVNTVYAKVNIDNCSVSEIEYAE